MARTKTPPKVTCKHCSAEVTPLGGKQITRGKSAEYRHATAPVGCSKGDPLMRKDVRGAPKSEEEED